MAATYILFFDGHAMTALRARGGFVELLERFAPNPVGMEALVALLRQQDPRPVLVLADTAEEGFQLEAIPRLQGGDRQALLGRRLGQYFYGTPYVTAVSLGHESDGRRDERILFAALTRSNMIAPWLDALRDARIPMRGLFSAPLVLGRQKLAFAAAESRYVVVTASAGGLRQSFFDGGQLRFSRLTQVAGTTADGLAIACSKETTKTVQYLLGQRQISRGTSLPVFVIAHAADHAAFARHCSNVGDIDYRLVDIRSFADALGYRDELAGSLVDKILAHCLAARTPAEQFAPESERSMLRVWQIRLGLRVCAAALAGTALMASGKLAIDASSLVTDSAALRTATALDQRRYEAILSGLPIVSVTPDNLRATLAAFDEIEKRSPALAPALAHLGASLAEFPGIELKRIEWAAEPPREGTPALTAPGASTTANGMPANGMPLRATLDVEGTLPLALAGDQRRQIEMMDRLAARLQRDEAQVRVMVMPVDVQPEKPLRSDDRAGSTGAGMKPFVLRFTLPASALRNLPAHAAAGARS